jgi:hypothetical protein
MLPKGLPEEMAEMFSGIHPVPFVLSKLLDAAHW